MSLRPSLYVPVLIGLVILVMGYSVTRGAFLRYQERWFRQEVQARAEVLAQSTAQAMADPLARGDDLEVARMVVELQRHSGVFQVIAVDRQDKVVSAAGSSAPSPGNVYIPQDKTLRQVGLQNVFGTQKYRNTILYTVAVPITLPNPARGRVRIGALYVVLTPSFLPKEVLGNFYALERRIQFLTLGGMATLFILVVILAFLSRGGEGNGPVLAPAEPSTHGVLVEASETPEHLQPLQSLLPLGDPPSRLASYGLNLDYGSDVHVGWAAREDAPFVFLAACRGRTAASLFFVRFLARLVQHRIPDDPAVPLSDWLSQLELAVDFLRPQGLEVHLLAAKISADAVEVVTGGSFFAFSARESDPSTLEALTLHATPAVGERGATLIEVLLGMSDTEPVRFSRNDLLGLALAGLPDPLFASRLQALMGGGTIPAGELEQMLENQAFGVVLALERSET